MRDNDVDAIAAPEIDITAGEDDGPLTFDAVVEVRPSVAIPGYDGLQVTIERPEASDEEIRRQVDRLRGNFAVLSDVVRPAQDGDNLTIDIKTTRGGESSEPVDGLSADDFLYELGSEAVVPELDDQLQGARPATSSSSPPRSRTVPRCSSRSLVKDIKEKILPDLTDEWVSEASEFDTVAELEADLTDPDRNGQAGPGDHGVCATRRWAPWWSS